MKQPNFLLICTDHLSDLSTRPGGHQSVMTPTLSQLARCGSRFSRAYSACPSCIPARKSLMTGLNARAHGDRVYRDGEEWPRGKTLPQCFRDAGYQAYAVGKMHVWPQRDRLGFDDVVLEEQGRHQHRSVPDGVADDWELYLQEQGYAGMEYAGGMTQNDFVARAWHLPENLHPVNWATREMCRAIRRRDPGKPAFWYLSYSAPHPPMTPLRDYLELYGGADIEMPVLGEWSRRFEDLPWFARSKTRLTAMHGAPEAEIRMARLAYYATITHIDHQIRVVIGCLREAQLLDNTFIVFTSDHGHMLGDHQMWCMTPFYEMSARIPLVIVPPAGNTRVQRGHVDDRFAEFGDIMPTLLDLAGLEIPPRVNQLSLVGEKKREYIYGEHGEGHNATRMIRRGRYKLIYYPAGNRIQLFNIEADPHETRDLAADPENAECLSGLQEILVQNTYGNDSEWAPGGRLAGLSGPPPFSEARPHIGGQRGLRYL